MFRIRDVNPECLMAFICRFFGSSLVTVNTTNRIFIERWVEDVVVNDLRLSGIFGTGLELVVYHRARNRTGKCLFGHRRNMKSRN